MSNSTEVKTEERQNDDSRFHAMIAYAVVMVFVGIPLWWKTTEVYRAPLDYDRIDSLSSAQMKTEVEVIVLITDTTASHAKLTELQHSLEQSVPYHTNHSVQVRYSFEVRHLFQEERFALNKAATVKDADEQLQSAKKARLGVGQVTVYVVPESSKIWSESGQLPPVVLGRHLRAYVKAKPDLSTVVQPILKLLHETILERDNLDKYYSAAKTREHQQMVDRSVAKISPVYDVTFSLIVPEPSALGVTWDIETAEKDYLLPFTKKLNNIVTFNINSQVLYMQPLAITPEPLMGDNDSNGTASGYRVTLEHLSHVINPVETKLSSHISIHPALHFLLYVPPTKQTPLHVYDDANNRSDSNAILIPGWGGILIHNVADNKTIAMDRVMGVFVSQLRSLLGLYPSVSSDLVAYLPLDATSIHDWELELFLRRRAIQNTLLASSTLTSLSHLLSEIKNIAISDEVAEQVNEAITSIERAYVHFGSGNIIDAYMRSKSAFAAAEKAFFDPSVLSTLYFPEDQKYAIYIPLFLPVALNVIQSFSLLWKWIKSKGANPAA